MERLCQHLSVTVHFPLCAPGDPSVRGTHSEYRRECHYINYHRLHFNVETNKTLINGNVAVIGQGYMWIDAIWDSGMVLRSYLFPTHLLVTSSPTVLRVEQTCASSETHKASLYNFLEILIGKCHTLIHIHDIMPTGKRERESNPHLPRDHTHYCSLDSIWLRHHQDLNVWSHERRTHCLSG